MTKIGKTLRTPLSRVRYLGSARLGADENWLVQVTSVALIPLAIAFVWLVLSLLHKDYNGVRADLGQPLPAIVLLLFVIVGVRHMHIGMRSIILDYVDGHAREWALMANAFFAAALGLACVYAVLRIGFV
ncbi:MAG: succinate dehydrogenase, hydrophobic membrane anchor protein [Roseiarcus sp.]|jgi:succinate dehydrogenase / fumarate reductase membrane anchor subunit